MGSTARTDLQTMLVAATTEMVISGAICGAGVVLAGAYLVAWRPGRERRSLWQRESDEAFAVRMRRRRLGAALLGAISVAFFVGLNVLEPKRQPGGYIIYWLVVLVMLAWVVGLALLDLLQTRRMFRRGRKESDRHG